MKRKLLVSSTNDEQRGSRTRREDFVNTMKKMAQQQSEDRKGRNAEAHFQTQAAELNPKTRSSSANERQDLKNSKSKSTRGASFDTGENRHQGCRDTSIKTSTRDTSGKAIQSAIQRLLRQ